jgi:hypothetical protein
MAQRRSLCAYPEGYFTKPGQGDPVLRDGACQFALGGSPGLWSMACPGNAWLRGAPDMLLGVLGRGPKHLGEISAAPPSPSLGEGKTTEAPVASISLVT